MKKICISSESALDLPKSLQKEFDIHVIPITLILGEREVADGEVDPHEIYDYVEESGKLARTAAVNEFAYTEFFSSLLQEYDHIIHFSLSSKLSACCANAISASHNEELEGKVTVIDTLSLSAGLGYFCIKASLLAKEGKDVPEIVDAYHKLHEKLSITFFVEQLEYLYKGGRCSRLALFGANLLKLRPQILVREGALVPGVKFRGPLNKVVNAYLETVEKDAPEFDDSIAFIAHTVMPEEYLESTKKRLLERGFKRVEIVSAGGGIACHCGPHAFGVIYFMK
ncbi:MAG: DegV family protein [Candidatus Enteromonas sp.]|nr:DegV family protein [Candidatus Enteromonas sp.]